MGDSKAHKKLKEDEVEVVERPEWVFKVFTKPAGLFIDHFGDKHNFSKDELEEVVTGEKSISYFDVADKKWKEKKELIDLGRYPWLPKGMYRAFVMNACDALGLVYRPYMVERITPEAMPKARIEFKQKSEVEKVLERTKDLEVKYRIIGEEIKALEDFWKLVKKK